ncbi:gluconokinase [Phormidium sp. CLA17]|uniref:gluconokinase n=1 Tax=Leptolyngbya sp. Cla-17 TaxID=2803751 RepID=UPI0014926660|nr:gluconokinase [Leptolyngbya sp. Cla-17]MBM0742016.1 gluconokinase [Leptolyngbya sp. Cla-17]
MHPCPLVWIVIGVAGSGKTVVGRLLSQQLECDFLEGDRRHPLPNIVKMTSHIPLEDSDRRSWLLEIENDTQRAIALKRETVLTCSALKLSYRKQLTAQERVQLVWLNVPEAELERRLSQRANHYMQLEMLRSQIATFEPIQPDENAIIVNGLLSPVEVINELLSIATQLFPNLKKSWWQRCYG